MGNIFGKLFTLSTWGEGHGGSIGAVVAGCPPRIPLSQDEIQNELNRRKPGQNKITSQRIEDDIITIHSGLYEGKTLGTPIAMSVANRDARPEDYKEMSEKFRPSHADYTYQMKYGIRNPTGGGRSSARETIARVAAGVIARKVLTFVNNIEIVAYVESVYNIHMPYVSTFPTRNEIDSNIVRCPDLPTAEKMINLIEKTQSEGDSLGGIVACRIRNVPVGLGEPVFDRLEADLAKAMLSLPATKGFEIGSGFAGTQMKGSEHNDVFDSTEEGKIHTLTNYSGGTQGGISNGEEIYFRVAFKPTSTIFKKQKTVDIHGNKVQLQAKGRHDPCVLPRAVPIVEAMASLVLVDHWLRHCAQNKLINQQSVVI